MESKDKNAIIRLFHVYKRYATKNALSDISLDVMKNEFIFLTGPSGAGKSTLLRLLYIGTKANEGQIIIDGVNIARIPARQIPMLRRNFGIIFQDFKLIPTKTVFENVALVLEVMGKRPDLIEKKVRYVLRSVGMEDRVDIYPPSLSGGEQQRVAVARAVIGDPKIILADEPTGSLDDESAAGILELLLKFHRRGTTVIIASHNKELIQEKSSRVVLIQQGRIEMDTNL